MFKPITVASQFEAQIAFPRLNFGIKGSNPSRGMDYIRVFSMLVSSCVGSGLETGWILSYQLSVRFKIHNFETHSGAETEQMAQSFKEEENKKKKKKQRKTQ
jgi:hypothetical protein